MGTYRYQEIANDLREQMERGVFDNQKIPSERALMAHYGVQRNTVRRALAILGAEGRITRSSKRRSYVTPDSRVPTRQDSGNLPGTILVVMQGNDFSTTLESLLRGLTQSLTATELSLLYFDSRPRPGRFVNELPDTDFLLTNSVRAIVLWPQSLADPRVLTRLRDFAPLILVDRQISGFETHSVVFDDFGGGRAITEHLVSLGHRRIGFLTDEVFAETVQQRWRGYAHALQSAGIVVEPTCYGLFQGMHEPPYTGQMRLLLEGGRQPLTAVVCSNDNVAMDLLHFLRREGYRVPEDIAVTGFGNLMPNSLEAMRLTTMLQPFEEAGQAVGRLILSQLTATLPTTNTPNYEHIEIPVQLVVRSSSGAEECTDSP